MEFGVTASQIDEIGFVTHAENLGYSFCWVYDSQFLASNPWAVLALLAQQTRTMAIGTGVAVPGLRLAPVTANGIATINRLAPGRTFLGIGTGNTAMRTLGQRPMPVAEFAEYLRVVRGLLNGDEVQYTLRGTTHTVQFQNVDRGYLDLAPRIPIHVGGFGPKAQALAGEWGDGLITGIPRGGSITSARANAKSGADRVGRAFGGFRTFALMNLLMLEPGESLTSARVIEECGSSIMANVHYLVDLHRETGASPPDYVLPIWDDYLAFHRTRDQARSHLEMHRSHYAFLDPDEARFVTPEMIRNFTLCGQPDEIADRIRALEAEGLNGMVFALAPDQQYRVIEDFARRVMPLL